MSDLIDRAKVQSELRAYLVHESSEIAQNVEQIVAAIPATDAREKALREAAAAWQAFKAANTTTDHFNAVERLDAILIGEART